MKRIVLLIFPVIFSCSQSNEIITVDQALSEVSGEDIKSHIAYLADDKLLGRLPGTAEYQLAVNYVTDQFKKLNLLPGGNNGTYLQEVTIRKGFVDASRTSLSINGESLVLGDDFVTIADLNSETNQVEAEIVFVGYGINAPHLNHNDYEGLDVSGKIIAIIYGAPSSFAAAELAHFSNFETKFEMAIEQGAAGIIFSLTDQARFQRFANRFNTRPNTGVVGPSGNVFGRRVFPKELKCVLFANWESLNGLTEIDLNELWDDYPKNNTVNLNLNASVKTAATYEELKSPNVIGIIEGSDPVLKNEYVVHSAHLDHVGIGTPVNGDSIYNGAHDNASGVASGLEIANIYSKLSKKPKRSILFVMVTAEEMGLLGSDYFTRFPTVPIENIVANVNTDMPTLIAPLLSIEPLGAEHSSLMENVRLAANKLGLEVMPDHMPEQVRFVRSDQYNFIRRGIPALHIKYGLKSENPDEDLTEAINDYTANVYHKPSDELNDLFDFGAAEIYVKLNFLISHSISERKERPMWNEGDFFGNFK